MENNELISVIVPIYNVEDKINRCINSLIKQTYTNIEIILIDDGSTDNSSKICDSYKNKDSRVMVIHKENQGVSSARNDGIKISRGKFITFVDSDDYVEDNFIEVMYNNIKKYNCDVSICNYYYEKNDKIVKSKIEKEIQCELDNKEFYKNLIFNHYRGVLWNKLFSRKVFYNNDDNTYNLLNENIYICEDLLFLVENMKNVPKIYYDKNCYLYHYVLNENSTYSSSYNKRRITEIDAFDKIIENIRNIYPDLLDYYMDNYLGMAIMQKALYMKSNFRDSGIKEKIDNSIKKYYYMVLKNKNISIKKKIYHIVYYRFPFLITIMKKIKHKLYKI